MRVRSLWIISLLLLCPAVRGAETFRIATFNVENYLDRPTESRPQLKTDESKAKIRDTILSARPDILALQEIGEESALLELRDALKAAGWNFPHWEHVRGFDTNINVAVLSRFPIVSRRPHTNETFLLSGRRFRTSRGFAEVDIKLNEHYTLTLFTAHLKSKRATGYADESEIRHEEAKRLRKIVDANLAQNPNANLVVLGDLNDTRNSSSVRTLLGRGRTKLLDIRPAEHFGIPAADQSNLGSNENRRSVTWTHFFALEDTYSRIDYILLSSGMAREWIEAGSGVLAHPDWGTASDHRLVFATFEARNQIDRFSNTLFGNAAKGIRTTVP
jgi:endonuclease/exonuclease/phosphatase family metal-dependent hydrolase